jgi:hypothetical protein
MLIENELPSALVEESIVTLSKTGPFTYAEMHPCPDHYTAEETRELISANTRCVENLTAWRQLLNRVLDPDDRIVVLEKLVARKLIEASSVISSLSPTVN